MSEPVMYEYNQEVLKGFQNLYKLGPQRIAEMQEVMSILIYRLSKLLTDNQTPPNGQTIRALLRSDINKHYYMDDRPQIDKALEFLCLSLEMAAFAVADTVQAKIQPRKTIRGDDLYERQDPTLRDTNKPYSTWARELPFRPLFCKLATFAFVFPVRPNAKHYDDLPDEDRLPLSDGDKPKVRLDKQRTFATLLDAIDYMQAIWRSPIKSETAYDVINRQPYMSGPGQRPDRRGRCYWRKPKGSASPDLVIVRRIDQPPTPANVTHCVDMKFGGDDISRDQIQKYLDLFPNRLYVLYFPRECTTGEAGEKTGTPATHWAAALAALLAALLSGGGGRGRDDDLDGIPGTRPRPAPGGAPPPGGIPGPVVPLIP